LQEKHPTAVGRTSSTTGDGGTAAELADLCRRAEATGADSLWVVDHLFWPHTLDEAMTTLAIAASATRRPSLGTCILQLPLRDAPTVAKQATNLQLLSGGRFVLGLGVGSHKSEYEQAGVDFHRRGELMDAGIARIKDAWASADEPDGAYRQLPASTRVPIWLGGSSEPARRRAAAVADGWIPLFLTAEQYGPALQALRRETEEAGRPADAVEPGVVVFARVGPADEAMAEGCAWLSNLYGIPAKAFERHLIAGPSEACAAGLARFVEAGARHIAVMVAGSDAVGHFGFLRSAFRAAAESILSGVPA
jgi:alkanesulfonate monooxygenase SsuD/methylene tetrahydromethanopterin reductase-like flavin-dependent oxidoreductase (luciferase family)